VQAGRTRGDQRIDTRPAHRFALLLHQPQLQHLGLDLDVISIGLIARRLPPLASQPSQLGNADLIEREAVTFPLDQAFGFELACVHRCVTARCELFSGTTDRYGTC
jgi:hypothetical protein